MSYDDKHTHGYDPYDRPNGYDPNDEVEFLPPYFNTEAWTGAAPLLPYMAFRDDILDSGNERGDDDRSDRFSY